MPFLYWWAINGFLASCLKGDASNRFLSWDYNIFVESVLRDGPTNELHALGFVVRCFFGVVVSGKKGGNNLNIKYLRPPSRSQTSAEGRSPRKSSNCNTTKKVDARNSCNWWIAKWLDKKKQLSGKVKLLNDIFRSVALTDFTIDGCLYFVVARFVAITS